jgi:K+-sensing histidine kinase KdpD/CheY-like chemotaxis protein
VIFPLIGSEAPFLFLLAPILISAWFGGLGPSVVAGVLAYLAGIYFFLPPFNTWSFTPKSGIHALVFGIECTALAGLTLAVRAGYRNARGTARRMSAMAKISGSLGKTGSIDEVGAAILDEAIAALSVDAVAMYLRSDAKAPLRLEALHGRKAQWIALTRMAEFKEVAMNADAAVALAARSQEIVAFGSPEERLRLYPERLKELRGPAPEAVLCAPLIVGEETLGVLVILWARSRNIPPEDRTWAQGVAQSCAFAIERTRLFDAEREARMRAEDATRGQEAFFSSVSHELRAPLMSTLGWVHTLQKGRGVDRARHAHGLKIIEGSVESQARLVDELIEMSRATSRRLRLDVKSAEFAPLVRSWLDAVRETADSKGVALEAGPQSNGAVAVDIARLGLAMRKVLDDAIASSPAGERVSLVSEDRAGRVYVRVQRKGTSKDDAASKASQPQRKVAGAGDSEHLGLNLSIANVIVQQHGGTLSVDLSGPEHAVTVTLDLPALDPKAGLLAASSPASTGATLPLAGSRVLLVDEDTDAREAVAATLAADGADVRAEPSAKAGLGALGEFTPTVIVSAVGTSGEDGHGFIRAVRDLQSPVASVPAIALTAGTVPDAQAAALDASFQRRIAKPPRPHDLSDAVAQMHASSGAH